MMCLLYSDVQLRAAHAAEIADMNKRQEDARIALLEKAESDRKRVAAGMCMRCCVIEIQLILRKLRV